MKRYLLIIFAGLFGFAIGLPAQAGSSPFDGVWNVTLSCPSNSEASGALGYTYKFPAQVRDGILAGQYGVEDTPNSLKIAGQIQPDGSAMLRATGRVGNPAYAVKRTPTNTAYSYDIKAQFSGSQGTGSRLTARKCDLVFALDHAYSDKPVYATPSQPEHVAGTSKIALVIGNSAYLGTAALKNPVNDAKDVADALQKVGFHVILKTNVTLKEMTRAITIFGAQLKPGDIALFYYAGHGLQAKGRNFMVPVDAEISSEASIRSETVDVDQLLEQLSPARLSIVILDACRNNPYERSLRSLGGSGLAQVDAPKGTLIAYATAPGHVAADGGGRNGLYTAELLRALNIPGMTVEGVFKKVRISVAKASADRQIPWEASSLTGEFCFTNCGNVMQRE